MIQSLRRLGAAFILVMGATLGVRAQTATTTTLAISPSTSPNPAKTLVTLTATVRAASTPVQPGLVTFCDATATYCAGLAVVGTAQLTTSGTAVLRFIPGGGTHSYKAVFAGKNSYSSSISTSQSVTIQAATSSSSPTTTTTIASSGSLGNYTLTATVVGTGYPPAGPTGNVAFINTTTGNTVLGTEPLGPATLTRNDFVGGPGSPVAVGTNPYAIAVGDFNGDGVPDLAIANNVSDNLTILLGNGSGGFSQASGSPIPVGNGPSFVAVGDFNSDGNVDLAIAEDALNDVLVYLGNGGGGFTQSARITGGISSPYSVTVGDFNRDGIPDLAIINSNASGRIYVGNGDGTFSMQGQIAVGTTSLISVVGDFNGDGILDLAVANNGSNNLTILLGNGSGGFSQASGSPITVGSGPYGLVGGDFNGDGKVDLAVANNGSNNVTVLLGNGNGTFSQAQGSPVAVGSSPRGIAVGDFNGDGKADLAVANSGSSNMTVLLGNGNGGFAPAPVSPITVGTNPYDVAARDFNGDGLSDLALANYGSNNVSILLSEVDWTATATLTGVSVSSPGTNDVKASYAGDQNYPSSTSSTIPLQGPPVNTTTAVTSSLNPSTYGQSVTFTATVSPATGSAPPAGTVQFYVGGVAAGSAVTLMSGVGTFTTNALTAGTHSITAVYTPASSAYVTSTSSALSQVVSMAVLTVTADNHIRVFGAANPTLTYLIAGFVNGDTSNVVSGTPALSTTATTSSPVGMYPITVALGTLSAANYSFSLVNGTLTVTQATTGSGSSTTLTVSPTTVQYGDTSTLTAVVSPAGATGTVTFTATPGGGGAAVTLGTASAANSGTAAWPENTLPAGTYNIVAQYSGDPNIGISTSIAVQLTVTQRHGPGGPTDPALTVTVNDASRTTTQANPPFSYTVSGTLVNSDTSATAVTGTPTFSTLAGTTAGTFAITVAGLTSANYALGFVPGTLTVVPTPTTTTLSTSPGSPQYGDPVTLTATVSATAATGTVSFYDGSTNVGPGTVLGGVAMLVTTMLTAGTHSITAIYNGDATYASSMSPPATVTVAKKTAPGGGAALTVTVQDASREFGTANPQFVYVVSGTLLNNDSYATAVTGVPSFSTAATPTSPAGSTYPITVSNLISQNYVVNFANGTLTIVSASTTTALNASVTSVQYGDPVMLTAAVTSGATGTVAFVRGSTVLGQGTLSAGVVTLTTTTFPAGTYVITAVYHGDGNYGSSVSGPVTLTVTKRTGSGPNGAALTVTVNDVSRQFGQGNPAFMYTVTGTLVNGETFASAVTGVPVFSTTAILTSPVGTYPITVTGGLNSANYVIAFVNGTLTVTKGTPSVTLTSSANPSAFSASVTFTAALSAGATGTVTFLDGSTTLGTATVSGGTASYSTTTLAVGTRSITAVYSGDTNYNGATSAALLQVVNTSPEFTFAANNPTYQTVIPGRSVTYSFTFTPSTGNSYPCAVNFTATSSPVLPAGYQIVVTPPHLVAGAGAQPISVQITTLPVADGSKRSSPWLLPGGISLALILLPLSLARRTRTLQSRKLILLVVGAAGFAATAGLAGCAGGFFGRAPVNYAITLTATSACGIQTETSHSSTVTLNVQ